MLISLLMAQAAVQLPDIQLKATVRARSLTIVKQGEASLAIRTEPEGPDLVDVRAPKANGRKTIRNVAVDVNAEAHIADPNLNRTGTETTAPK